ncbi:MAG: glutathione S-transferase family protein [Pseudomonadota bacterium]
MLTIHGDTRSGNCHKVAVTCRLLGREFDWVEVDIMAGATRTVDFLAMNPAGQVPTVVLEDGRPLAQSNAIMLYLAKGSALIPADAYARARMLEWLFWEQYSHEPYVATPRFQRLYQQRDPDPWRMERGEQALDHLEALLTGRDWLVGDALTLADIALSAYTCLAEDAGFSLAERPSIDGWLARLDAAGGLFHGQRRP